LLVCLGVGPRVGIGEGCMGEPVLGVGPRVGIGEGCMGEPVPGICVGDLGCEVGRTVGNSDGCGVDIGDCG
jgi:hypothetical protein